MIAIMADEYQTPPTSVTPSTEHQVELGPAEVVISPGMQMSIARASKTTFASQRQNDRNAVHTYIKKHLNTSGKTSMVAVEDRLDLLKKLRKEKIELREEAGSGSTRVTFKAKHNEAEEDSWLRTKFEKFLRPSSGDQDDEDRDDDEDMRPINRVKNESMDDDFEDAETRSAHAKKTRSRVQKSWKEKSESPLTEIESSEDEDEEGNEDDEDESEDEDAPKKAKNKKRALAESSVCSRALGIILGCDGSKAKKVRLDRSAKDHSTAMGSNRKANFTSSWQWSWEKRDLMEWTPLENDDSSGKPE